MKAMKLCSIMFGLLLATTAQASVVINEETFPDETFRSLITRLPEGKDGILTGEEIGGLKRLAVSDYDHKIKSFQGLEYLTELEVLDIEQVYYTEKLDLSNNPKLTFVNMEFVGFQSLNLSGLSALKQFICQAALLQEVDMSTCTALQSMYVDAGLLTTVNLSNSTNLKRLTLKCNRLTSLDLSNNINLEMLDCSDNRLTSLDLSNNINLKELNCSYNQLTSLILPRTETLTDVKCFANHLSGESMDQVIAMLPIVAKGDFYPYIEIANVVDEGPQTEFNVCTTIQVEAAKSKNWTVYGIYHVTSGLWDEYAGSEPTSIRPAIQGSTASDCYSLDGRRINWQDRHKGIYIQNGKKVVIK